MKRRIVLASFLIFLLFLCFTGYAEATRWDFPSGTDGWTGRNCSTSTSGGGYLFCVDTPPLYDPGVVSPTNLNLSASVNQLIKFRMASQWADSTGYIYFTTTTSSSFDNTKKVFFSVTNDGGWDPYSIDMSVNSAWSGTIKQIRIDSAINGLDNKPVGFDWIETSPKIITPTHTVSKTSMTVGESVTLTCGLTSAGAGRRVAFFVKNGSTTVSSTTRITNSSGNATWTPTAQSNWQPSVSTQCRDESTMATSSWRNINILPPPAPNISVSPTTVNEMVQSGSYIVKTITVYNTGSATLTVYGFTAYHDNPSSPSWIGPFNPTSLSVPAGSNRTFTFNINATNLPASSRTGRVIISSNDSDTPSVTINVNLTVTPPPAPNISVVPTTVNETVESGQYVVKTVTVNNTGNATLTVYGFTAYHDNPPSPSWIGNFTPSSLSVSAGTSRTFTFNINAVNLPVSSRTGRVIISSNDPDTPSVTINVNLSVTPQIITPTLTVSKTSMSVGESVTLTCNLTSAGAGRDIAFFVNNKDTSTPVAGSPAPRVADGNGVATWIATAGTDWLTAVSVQCRDEVTGEVSTPWQDITVDAANGNLALSPDTHNYGVINVGNTSLVKSFTASNTGLANLLIGNIIITGSSPSDFSISNDNCSGMTIAPSENCTVQAFFSPSSYGPKSANISIPSNDSDTPVFNVTIQGTGGSSGTSTITGIVNDETYNPLSDVSVVIGPYPPTTTNGSGQYSISGISSGNYTATVSKSGYAEINQNIYIPPSTTITKNFTLSASSTPGGDIRVIDITSKYSGYVYYLDEVDHNVTFTANIDWAGHPPEKVRFITPVSFYDVLVSGSTALKALNMGTDFGSCGKLRVQAISSDGTISSEYEASFTVMTGSLLFAPPLRVVDQGDSFKYDSVVKTAFNLFDEGVDAGIIPENMPLFGGEGFNISLIPELIPEIRSDGTANLNIPLGDSASLGGGVAGMGFNIDIYDFTTTGTYSEQACSWSWGGNIAADGQVWASRSVHFPVPVGPVIIPMYGKVSLEIDTFSSLAIQSLDPVVLSGDTMVSPYVRGALGAGIDEIAGAELWISGRADMGLQWPQEPTLHTLDIFLSGGLKEHIWVFEWEQETFECTWNYFGNIYDCNWGFGGSSGIAGAAFISSSPSEINPKLVPRTYLNDPEYGLQKQASVFISKTIMSSYASVAPIMTSIAAVQNTIFPYSAAYLASSGNNLYLVWLYDDPQRADAINRTVAVFARWEGTAWTTMEPIEDDGTADFHPKLISFSNGNAVAAWENQNAVLDSSVATFEDMVTNMDISVSSYDALTAQWSGTQALTANSYLDRSPKLSGMQNSLLLTWISNEFNNLSGTSAEPNKLWYSLWNGTLWSVPQIAADIPYGLIKYSIIYNGTQGHAVFSLDTDDTTETINDRELFTAEFTAGAWGPLTRITNDVVPDDNPQVSRDSNGNVVLIWLKDGDVSGIVDFDMGNVEVIYTDEYSTNIADLKLASTEDGKLALLWAEPSEYSSDLFAVFYDPIFRVWGRPRQLYADEETERGITAAFLGNETLVAVYNRNIVQQQPLAGPSGFAGVQTLTQPVVVGTDLYMLKYTMGEDLALEGGSLNSSPLNPAPGTDAILTVKAMNLGDMPFSDVTVAFYLGNPDTGGTEITSTTITGVMSPGETRDVSVTWTVPTTTMPLEICAVIDPLAEDDPLNRFNNLLCYELVKPDLTIKSVSWTQLTETLLSITARISNEGVIPNSATTVIFKDQLNGGATLYSESIGPLGQYEAVDAGFVWDISIPLPEYVIEIVVDESDSVIESDETNNAYELIISGAALGDTDGDGIRDDEDGSGTAGDNPCTGGETTNCDDNCINTPNPDQSDIDNDGVGDVCDNCSQTANQGQQDTDNDGYGNACDCDLDNDGFVGPFDYSILRSAWWSNSSSANWNADADFDSDGFVGPFDFTTFRNRWWSSGPWD